MVGSPLARWPAQQGIRPVRDRMLTPPHGQVEQGPQIRGSRQCQGSHPRDRPAARRTPRGRRARRPGPVRSGAGCPDRCNGCPACANSQSTRPVTLRVSGSMSRFLGFRSLCTRQRRSTVSRRLWASTATACSPASSSGAHHPRDRLGEVDVRRQPVELGAVDVEATDPQVCVHERAGTQHRHRAERGDQPAELAAESRHGVPGQLRKQQVAADPGQERGDQQPGQPAARDRGGVPRGRRPPAPAHGRAAAGPRRPRERWALDRWDGRRSVRHCAPPPTRPGRSRRTSRPPAGPAREAVPAWGRAWGRAWWRAW